MQENGDSRIEYRIAQMYWILSEKKQTTNLKAREIVVLFKMDKSTWSKAVTEKILEKLSGKCTGTPPFTVLIYTKE